MVKDAHILHLFLCVLSTIVESAGYMYINLFGQLAISYSSNIFSVDVMCLPEPKDKSQSFVTSHAKLFLTVSVHRSIEA